MSNHTHRPNSLTEILVHLEKGEQAYKLLEEIWLDKETYSRTVTISDNLHTRLQKFFDFDDSE